MAKASTAPSWKEAIFYALLFSFSNNTVFSLMHESVHRTFSQNRWINNTFGRISAAFFPTGFSLQRGFHLGHHRRNRTDAEMFDLYYDHDIKTLKFFQWYCIFTGPYWLSVPLASVMYLFIPSFFNLSIFKNISQTGYQSGAEKMFSSLENESSPMVTRVEIIFSILFQILLFHVLDLTFSRWLLCYWFFGLNWGALQYADHAWSKRDIKYGAWNLKVPQLIHWIYLNYHYHLAHHVNPKVSWRNLPLYVDQSEYRPSFISIYLKMWFGPKPTKELSPRPLEEKFIKEMGL